MASRLPEYTAAEAEPLRLPIDTRSSATVRKLGYATTVAAALTYSLLQEDTHQGNRQAQQVAAAPDASRTVMKDLAALEEGESPLQRPLCLTMKMGDRDVQLAFRLERDATGAVVVDVGNAIYYNTQSIRGIGKISTLINDVRINGTDVSFCGGMAGQVDVPRAEVRQAIIHILNANIFEEDVVRFDISYTYSPGGGLLFGTALWNTSNRQSSHSITFRRKAKPAVHLAGNYPQ